MDHILTWIGDWWSVASRQGWIAKECLGESKTCTQIGKFLTSFSWEERRENMLWPTSSHMVDPPHTTCPTTHSIFYKKKFHEIFLHRKKNFINSKKVKGIVEGRKNKKVPVCNFLFFGLIFFFKKWMGVQGTRVVGLTHSPLPLFFQLLGCRTSTPHLPKEWEPIGHRWWPKAREHLLWTKTSPVCAAIHTGTPVEPPWVDMVSETAPLGSPWGHSQKTILSYRWKRVFLPNAHSKQ